MNLPKRSYSSPVRAQQARLTRRRILEAATALIAADGYASTTVAAVASAAGVSPQTVYNAFTDKPTLLKAAYDVAIAGDDEPTPLAERPEVKALYELTDPADFLHGYAALGRTLLDRMGALALQLAAGAANGDPDLIAHVEVTDEERAIGTLFVVRRVDALGALAPGLSLERARDRIWTLNSVHVWHLLTSGRGWSGDEYQEWIGDAMCDAILLRRCPGR